MSDPRNVAHDKKVIHEKQKHGEHLAEGAAHVPQPGKKTAREESHGAHKETDAEKAGGSFAEPVGKRCGDLGIRFSLGCCFT
jgi:hypothetical protein